MDAADQRVEVRAYRTPGSLLLLEGGAFKSFKLLKSHGQQLEQWQQETGPAIARRLLVASMACVVVWQLQADDTPQATELRAILIRLSGRQMKRNRPHTAPASLAGLWVLLSMLALLEHYDLDDLRRLAAQIPVFRRT